MNSMSYFKAIQGGNGVATDHERFVRENQRRLALDLPSSANVKPTATRNGKPQVLVAVETQTSYKYEIIAMPGDELLTGDLLEFENRHWIVVEVPSAPVLHYTGIAWECNHLFRFQTFDGDIVERWGVIDSGNYSTDVQHGSMLTDTNSQYRLYMQLDDQTKQIFIDKRLAVAQIFDKDGRQILDVYKVTDVDPVTQSYGGGHLLVLRAVSDAYNAKTDRIDILICDYNEGGAPDTPTPDKVVITGPDELRPVFGRKYTASYEGAPTDAVFTWDFTAADQLVPYVHLARIGNEVQVTVDRGAPVGMSFRLTAASDDPNIAKGEKSIKVVSLT